MIMDMNVHRHGVHSIYRQFKLLYLELKLREAYKKSLRPTIISTNYFFFLIKDDTTNKLNNISLFTESPPTPIQSIRCNVHGTMMNVVYHTIT